MAAYPEYQYTPGGKKGITGLIAGLGCVGTIAIVVISVVVCVAAFGGFYYGISKFLQSSEPYTLALERAQTNEDVIEALGTPVEPGWWVIGSISVTGVSGEADLQFPISGPRNSGIVYVTARRENAVWNFYTLAVAVNGQDQLIDLR